MMSTEKEVVRLIMAIAQGEKTLETLETLETARQILAELHEFEPYVVLCRLIVTLLSPYAAFQRLDRHYRGYFNDFRSSTGVCSLKRINKVFDEQRPQRLP